MTDPIQPAARTGPRLRRWILVAAAFCVIGWLGLLAYVDWAMRQPPEVFGGVMAHMPMPAFFVLPFETLWNRTRAGNLQPGDQAPTFTLKELQGGEAPVDMASLWKDRPVALVFGSYT
jgi:hypothetical protein